MLRSQKGMSVIAVVLLIAIAVFFVILGFKCVPVYTEYFGIKRVIKSLVQEGTNASAAEIKEMFNRKMTIEYATAVKSDDLVIVKDSGTLSISTEYDKHVRLFGEDDGTHIDLLFHFNIQEGRAPNAADKTGE